MSLCGEIMYYPQFQNSWDEGNNSGTRKKVFQLIRLTGNTSVTGLGIKEAFWRGRFPQG